MDMDVDEEVWVFCDGPSIPSELLEGKPSAASGAADSRQPLGDITREVWRALAASGVFSKDKAVQQEKTVGPPRVCPSLQLTSSSPITSPVSKRHCSVGAFMQTDGPRPQGLPPRSPAPSKLQPMNSLRQQSSSKLLLSQILPPHASPTQHTSPAGRVPSTAAGFENSYTPHSPTQTKQNSPARACLLVGGASSPFQGMTPGSPSHSLLAGSPACNTVKRGLIFR